MEKLKRAQISLSVDDVFKKKVTDLRYALKLSLQEIYIRAVERMYKDNENLIKKAFAKNLADEKTNSSAQTNLLKMQDVILRNFEKADNEDTGIPIKQVLDVLKNHEFEVASSNLAFILKALGFAKNNKKKDPWLLKKKQIINY